MKPIQFFLDYTINNNAYSVEISFDKLILEHSFQHGFIHLFTEKSEKNSIFKIDLETNETVVLKRMLLRFQLEESYEKILWNGYQSWTTSGEYTIENKFKKLSNVAKPLLRFMGDERFYPYEKNSDMHGYTYAYLKKEDRSVFFAGSLNERFAYTRFILKNQEFSVEKDIQNLKFKGSRRVIELMVSQGIEAEILPVYFKRYGEDENSISVQAMDESNTEITKPVTGWTSWYNYYTGISEEIILQNIKEFSERKIPLDIFQIDDGFQRAVGDWLTFNEKFPNGFERIVPAIHRAGYQAGLWLAPFITEKKSFIYQDHPDWLQKDESGKPLKVGFNPLWGGWLNGYFYGIDIYNKEFQDYLREVFYEVTDKWKFDMVKLDFLYASGMVHRGEKSRAETMHDAMDLLRVLVGQKKILGCGVPLAAAFKKIEACRIGSDIGLEWEDKLLSRINYRERVSTVNSLKSTLGRWHQNYSIWLNDPDVFNLRGNDNKLSDDEKYTLFIINLTLGGLVFTSDSLHQLTDKEYKLYLSLFPVIKKQIISVDQINEDVYQVQFSIKEKNYILISNFTAKKYTWNNQYQILFNSRKYGFLFHSPEIKINSHESVLFYLPEISDFSILGSSGYLYPGSEVDTMNYSKKYSEANEKEYHIEIEMKEDLKSSGELYIQVPDDSEIFYINGKKTKPESIRHLRIVRYYY